MQEKQRSCQKSVRNTEDGSWKKVSSLDDVCEAQSCSEAEEGNDSVRVSRVSHVSRPLSQSDSCGEPESGNSESAPAVLQSEKGPKKNPYSTTVLLAWSSTSLMDLILTRRRCDFNPLTSCEWRRGRATAGDCDGCPEISRDPLPQAARPPQPICQE
ncbi:uncharacterized [Tachysurus ichikawai]